MQFSLSFSQKVHKNHGKAVVLRKSRNLIPTKHFSRQLNNYLWNLVTKTNYLNVSSYFFYRPKVTGLEHFFTLFWKENTVIGRTISSGRLLFNFKQTSNVFAVNCNGDLQKILISTSTVLLWFRRPPTFKHFWIYCKENWKQQDCFV